VVTVIPFRAGGKSRLPRALRRELALAMLVDVVEAALGVGEVRVVTGDVEAADAARLLGAQVVVDPGGGQGRAVEAGLDGLVGPSLVVNADLPCATPAALARLSEEGLALVAAPDGTTNALSVSRLRAFRPLYGPGSAERFAAAGFVPIDVPELARDIDTLADLEAVGHPLGGRTTLVMNRHKRRQSATR
jgi:2-phospho-L-lactate guanylyltransferase